MASATLNRSSLAGDFWGGFAAMLVALPSAIAFGVTIYSPLGGSYAAYGALAGILGATALGLIAPAIGGTNRLITAPCAPAAAVLSAFTLEYVQQGAPLASALLMMTLLGLLAGLFQISFGLARIGRLIKYMPYPVVSGYMTAVGLIIIGSQVPKFLGASSELDLWGALSHPETWHWQSLVVGVVTATVMLGAAKVIRVIPAAILGLLAGVLSYFGISQLDPALLTLEGNALIVGPLSAANSEGGLVEGIFGRWQGLDAIDGQLLEMLITPALTLAVLLSIDTLKTAIILDALTRTRHNSNRELIAQGVANLGSAFVGGVPGAGTMGPSLVNFSSGAVTRYSGLIEGVLALIAFMLLSQYIAWVPIAALAAILIVIGVRMIDRNSLQFLKSRTTVLDFLVIAAVVTTALTVGLIPASAIGVVLAILLFVKEQVGGKVVRHRSYGDQHFSRRMRRREEMALLTERGAQTAIYELQGSLFFGTADQLYRSLEDDLKVRRYVILDMRKVQTVDVTAAHILDQMMDILGERNGYLIFSHLPRQLPSGLDMQGYFDAVGLVRPESPVRIFSTLDGALQWVEDRIITEAALTRDEEKALDLHEMELFTGRKSKTISALEACMEQCTFKAGEAIFNQGDSGDELYLIRRGEVRILLEIGQEQHHHLRSFTRGAFFGEMAFLDGEARSADAVAFTDTELYKLSRKTFDKFSLEHKQASMQLLERLASTLAGRLRLANAEIGGYAT